MPIRPEMKARYPKNWPAIRAFILERANHCCEFCGLANYAIGYRTGGVFVELRNEMAILFAMLEDIPVFRIVLTIAHLDHIPEHCHPDNLRALCQRCHLAYDAEHHRRNAWLTRRARLQTPDLFEVAA